MTKYLLKRLLSLIFVVFCMSIIIFLVIYMLPADPARAVLGPSATNEQIAQKRSELGLDRPLAVQYGRYLVGLLHFDFGTSLQTGRPVLEEIAIRLPATMELTLMSLLIYVLLALIFGSVAALRRGSALDSGIRILSILNISIPGYWLALALQYIFYYKFKCLPNGLRLPVDVAVPTKITGMYVLDSLLTGNWQVLGLSLKHMILPVFCLVVGCLGVMTRMMRGQLLQELRKDYIRTARAKGISEYGIVMHHAMRNAISPIMTMIGMQAGGMIGGTVLIEKIFNWPGLGTYAMVSIQNFDLYVVAGIAMMMSFVFVIISLIIDVLYVVIDPRVRLTK